MSLSQPSGAGGEDTKIPTKEQHKDHNQKERRIHTDNRENIGILGAVSR